MINNVEEPIFYDDSHGASIATPLTLHRYVGIWERIFDNAPSTQFIFCVYGEEIDNEIQFENVNLIAH